MSPTSPDMLQLKANLMTARDTAVREIEKKREEEKLMQYGEDAQ